MSESFNGFCIGVFMAIAVVLILSAIPSTSYRNIVETAKSECEKSLPRDQYCVIVAVPVSKN
jgi:Tfp pilus assembly protein PilE